MVYIFVKLSYLIFPPKDIFKLYVPSLLNGGVVMTPFSSLIILWVLSFISIENLVFFVGFELRFVYEHRL